MAPTHVLTVAESTYQYSAENSITGQIIYCLPSILRLSMVPYTVAGAQSRLPHMSPSIWSTLSLANMEVEEKRDLMICDTSSFLNFSPSTTTREFPVARNAGRRPTS